MSDRRYVQFLIVAGVATVLFFLFGVPWMQLAMTANACRAYQQHAGFTVEAAYYCEGRIVKP